jgi:hypothetical protein
MNKILVNDTRIIRVSDILNSLDDSIINNKPWALLRFGDGGCKVIHSFLYEDIEQMDEISKMEGSPLSKFEKIINFWATSANCCNYIDTPEVYFSNKFWNRSRSLSKKKMSEKTINRLKIWKSLYSQIKIKNTNYCNPEINFLSCLEKFEKKSLPNILENRKLCCITSRNDIKEKLSRYDIDVIKIVGKYEDHYKNSFSKVIQKIDEDSIKYDLWLIAAGELGRIYPGLIKYKGGRAFDIGSLIDFWCGDKIPSRLQPYLKISSEDFFKLTLTEDGEEFSKYI